MNMDTVRRIGPAALLGITMNVCACGDDDGTHADPLDDGGRADTGSTADAGDVVDTGVEVDAGDAVDAGGALEQIIAFHSERGGNADIYVMNLDGSGLAQRTMDPGDDRDPSISPDGRRIAFDSGRDGNVDIYVMNADGTGVMRLTTDPAEDIAPDWSPDGTRIAWTRSDAGGQNIHVMNADGSSAMQLTTQSGETTNAPSWSPDGAQITFESNRDGGVYEVYVMNADGSAQTRVTTMGGGHPVFAPDGSIVFAEGGDLFRIAADGTGLVQLTTMGDHRHPEVSLDGALIVYDGDIDSDTELSVVGADGSAPVRLTMSAGRDRDASFGRRAP